MSKLALASSGTSSAAGGKWREQGNLLPNHSVQPQDFAVSVRDATCGFQIHPTPQETPTVTQNQQQGPAQQSPTQPGPYHTSSNTPHPPHHIRHKLLNPCDIFEGLNEYVSGQRNVKIALNVGVHNHYKRIGAGSGIAGYVGGGNGRSTCATDADATVTTATTTSASRGTLGVDRNEVYDENTVSFHGSSTSFCESQVSRGRIPDDDDDDRSIANPSHKIGQKVEGCELDKSNIIIIVPTGSRKTLLVKTLALIYVPLVISDVTCLTQAGYVEEDVESILVKEPCRKKPRGDFIQIETTNILFISSGAFAGLEQIINKRMDAASIGFGAIMKELL